MNKSKCLFLSLAAVLLVGCQKPHESVTPTPDPDPTSSSSSTSEVIGDLAAPTLHEDLTGMKLVWDDVPGATGYEISIEDATYVAATEYSFDATFGRHNVKVRAVRNDEKGPATSFDYITGVPELAEVVSNKGIITWPNALCRGVDIRERDDTAFIQIIGDSYTVTKEGLYEVRPGLGYKGGYFFVDPNNERTSKFIVSSPVAQEELVIEDASAPNNSVLQDPYDVKVYDKNAWVDTIASISLSDANDELTPGKCAQFDYWKKDIWYKFEKEMDFPGAFDTISLYAKGDSSNYFNISFQILHSLPITEGDGQSVPAVNLYGVYISYRVPLQENSNWNFYQISMDDPGWVVDYGGTKMSFSQVATLLATTGYTVSSLADMFPFFDVVQLRLYGPNPGSYPSTRLWMDEIKLSNTGEPSSHEEFLPPPVLAYDYAFKGDGGYGTLHIGEETSTIKFHVNALDADLEFNPTVERNEDGSTMTIRNTGTYDFVYTGTSNDETQTYRTSSITGTMAPMLSGLQIAAYHPMDSFDYSETGQGYDASHAADARSGLRANYYAEYYSGSGSAPMGGSGWNLMGSTDYLNLIQDDGHAANGCARFKWRSDMDMRYATYGLSDGTATAIGKGRYLSFWAKGSANRAFNLKVRAFWTEQVTAGNAASASVSTVDTLELAQGADWTEIKLALDPTKVYFGFTLIPTKTSVGSVADYFFIDDICIYDVVSPWGN